MIQGCDTCIDEARIRMRDLDFQRIKAKQDAENDKKPIAICQDPASGEYYRLCAFAAYTGGHRVCEIVSNL